MDGSRLDQHDGRNLSTYNAMCAAEVHSTLSANLKKHHGFQFFVLFYNFIKLILGIQIILYIFKIYFILYGKRKTYAEETQDQFSGVHFVSIRPRNDPLKG